MLVLMALTKKDESSSFIKNGKRHGSSGCVRQVIWPSGNRSMKVILGWHHKTPFSCGMQASGSQK